MSEERAYPRVDPALRRATAADVGKRILVGVKNYDAGGNLTSQSQHLGEVVGVDEGRISIRWGDGQVTTLPPEVADAPRGTYRLRSSGQEVVDPDLLATWRFDWTAPNGEAGPND
jgi:hypothetical protein